MTTTTAPITFTIYGTPQQVGSKTPWNPRTRDGSLAMKNGKPIIATMDSNKKSKPWMAAVRAAAGEAFSGELLQGPVMVTARFYFSRPMIHYGKNGVKPQFAGEYCPKTPDLDKLLRAVGDALSGVVYVDDKQVVCYGVGTGKYWTREQERAEIEIVAIE